MANAEEKSANSSLVVLAAKESDVKSPKSDELITWSFKIESVDALGSKSSSSRLSEVLVMFPISIEPELFDVFLDPPFF